MKVVIADNVSARSCQAPCGVSWAGEALEEARQAARDKFGEKVSLRYVDLKAGTAEAAKLRKLLDESKASVPALVVDDEVRISGRFDMRMLLDVIATEMEIET